MLGEAVALLLSRRNAVEKKMSQPLPKISVLTVCRNRLRTLPRAVESVLSQESALYEYVIQDGASTDGSLEYLQGLANSKIRLVSQKDQGISDGLNRALHRVTGDWILFVHSDDLLVAGVMKTIQQSLVGANPNELQCFGIELVDENEKFLKYEMAEPRNISKHMAFPHPGMLAHRSLYETAGGFDPTFSIAMDYEWSLRAMSKGATLKPHPEIIQKMQYGGISTTRVFRANFENWKAQIKNGVGSKPTATLRFVKNYVRLSLHWLLGIS